MDGLPRVNDSSLWTVAPGGIYFVPADASRSIRYFDFATRQIHRVLEVDRAFVSGLSVSSDSRWLLYSQIGDVTATSCSSIIFVNRLENNAGPLKSTLSRQSYKTAF